MADRHIRPKDLIAVGEPRTAWRINAWCAEIGICRASFYNFRRKYPGEIDVLEAGGLVFVRTPPAVFLERRAAAEQQQAEAKKPAAATALQKRRGRPRKTALPDPAPRQALAASQEGDR
jgi:hypothetical protein